MPKSAVGARAMTRDDDFRRAIQQSATNINPRATLPSDHFCKGLSAFTTLHSALSAIRAIERPQSATLRIVTQQLGCPTMLLIIIAIPLLASPAQARGNGQWKDQPTLVRQWFEALMQPDRP